MPAKAAPRLQLDYDCLRSTGRFGASRFNRLIARQRHAHPALAIDFRLAEQTQRRVRLAQCRARLLKAVWVDCPSTKITAEADGPN